MPRKAVPRIDVVVTVAEAHLPNIEQLAGRLKSKGLTVTHTMGAIGTIAGSASPTALARLRKVAGVRAVEASGGVQIAPPESDVQ